MKRQSTTEQLRTLLEEEAEKFAKKESGLSNDIYLKFSKMGINTKSVYSLPLVDTIGKTFREQLQFASTELNQTANIQNPNHPIQNPD